MIQLHHFRTYYATIATVMFSLICSLGNCQQPAEKSATPTDYFADISVYSIHPEKGIGTYRGGYGSGGIGPFGTFGTGISRAVDNLWIEVAGERKGDKFLAKLSVKSEKRGETTKTDIFNRDYDLTDLQARSIEIARDDDGRVYRVNISPRVMEFPNPKAFTAKDLRLDRWSLTDTTVIINDQDYAGRLSMSGGRLATLDITGFASIEFSLVAFKDALPEGVLSNGTITINHGESSVQITNVKNGEISEILKGGPYRVYVRWKAPSQTIEQVHAMLAAQLPIAKSRLNLNDSRDKAMLERMEKMLKSDRFMLMSSSIGDIPKHDVIETQP